MTQRVLKSMRSLHAFMSGGNVLSISTTYHEKLCFETSSLCIDCMFVSWKQCYLCQVLVESQFMRWYFVFKFNVLCTITVVNKRNARRSSIVSKSLCHRLYSKEWRQGRLFKHFQFCIGSRMFVSPIIYFYWLYFPPYDINTVTQMYLLSFVNIPKWFGSHNVKLNQYFDSIIITINKYNFIIFRKY